ncbi:ANKRD13 [Lepeophtheirus salmonis]|uniref:ANKRD13 n=1 Tax=Lepeophtheirus salmonis TaxID=72036 RepID=A0A7R8CVY2_LEPSM|nr:ANKRD13 [Lepeophtheirus salmonis]CAF2898309.1 ANKRD13 [Lepeophtheirus salmonis]
MLESLTKGNGQILDQPNVNRESLAPPKKADITWDAYISSDPCNCLVLGRPHLCKESSKGFKATVAMSEDFPLTVDMLLNILEIVAPQFKHFQKLRDFVEMKLPPGFPVKVDVPVFTYSFCTNEIALLSAEDRYPWIHQPKFGPDFPRLKIDNITPPMNWTSHFTRSQATISTLGERPHPAMDFPLQFNFGSTYASSITVLFDWE